MFGSGYGWGAMHFVGTIVTGLFAFFVFLVVAALIFLLVRFLLVATTAAKIYVAKSTPAKAAEEPDATATAPEASATKPATKPRTPRTPPTPPAA